MGKIVTFGEIMLRLTPEGFHRFVQADRFGATYGGGEANVAVSLAGFGMDAQYITKLPKHDIGQAAVNALRTFGVDTGGIVRGGDRLGLYYLERGASQRPSRVIYDRANSAIALASPEEFDWDSIFEGASWFHFSGITPALGGNLPEICMEACKAAKAKGVTVSCDLNYRKNLWSREKAGQVMEGLMDYVDVFIGNEEQARELFHIEVDGRFVENGDLTHEGDESVATQLFERFRFKTVALTIRRTISADDNLFAAMMYDGSACSFSKSYKIHMVDRVGSGDGFSAGLIYGLLSRYENQAAVEFAAAAGCLKHSIEGDFNILSADEVLSLSSGGGSGRVQR